MEGEAREKKTNNKKTQPNIKSWFPAGQPVLLESEAMMRAGHQHSEWDHTASATEIPVKRITQAPRTK